MFIIQFNRNQAIADYLQQSGYHAALDAFKHESGLVRYFVIIYLVLKELIIICIIYFREMGALIPNMLDFSKRNGLL